VAGGEQTDGRADAARIAFLEAALAERDAKIAALTEQVAKLTELLAVTRAIHISRLRATGPDQAVGRRAIGN
jgi:hypothetical protein